MHGETPLRKSETRTNDGNRQRRHGARGATMRRDRPTRPTQRKGGGHAQDIARARQQSPPQKRTRPPPGRSERLRQGLQLRNKREKGVRPPKGKDQAEREELSQTRCRSEGHSKRSGSPRAVSKHKRQPADRSECRAGGPGSGPTVRGAQWRDPRTSYDLQLQRGPPGKKEPAAAGRKEEPPTKALTPTGRIKGRVPMTTPDPEPGSWRQQVTPKWDSEEHWRELCTTEAHGHSKDHLAIHPEGQGVQRRRRQRCEVHPGD